MATLQEFETTFRDETTRRYLVGHFRDISGDNRALEDRSSATYGEIAIQSLRATWIQGAASPSPNITFS